MIIATSTVHDGTMKAASFDKALKNRQLFLEKNEISPEQTVLALLSYEGDDYCRYNTVDKSDAGDGIVRSSTLTADALFTRQKNLCLFLYLADCIGAVLYDKAGTCLAVSHLGRHNLLQHGGTKSVEYFMSGFGIAPENVLVYLSPAAGKEAYPLFDFDNKSLHEVAIDQLLAAGVPLENMTVDSRDTTTDKELFSHSEFLKGNQETNGRHAIVAILN